MRYILVSIIGILFSQSIFSQVDSLNFIKYTADFHFKEGLYLSFDDLKNNSPLPKSRIISETNYNDPEFFDKVLAKSKVYYYDNIGNRNELNPNKIWGYSRNGFIYINIENQFFRITSIGSICHFIASHTTYYTDHYNNYSYYNSYYDPYYMQPNTYPNVEMRQYVLDFNTGRVLDYTYESIEVILIQDPELHDEFAALSKKKKKQLKFVYIRKFNEKNPLYFPKN